MGVFNDIVVNKLKIMDPKDLHKLFFPYNLGAYHYHKKIREELIIIVKIWKQ